MNIDKLAISVYDFLGYLLPGYVVLIACSSLSLIESNALAFAVVTLVVRAWPVPNVFALVAAVGSPYARLWPWRAWLWRRYPAASSCR